MGSATLPTGHPSNPFPGPALEDPEPRLGWILGGRRKDAVGGQGGAGLIREGYGQHPPILLRRVGSSADHEVAQDLSLGPNR